VRRYQLGIPVWRALVGLTQIEAEGVQYIREKDQTAVWIDARNLEESRVNSVPNARNLPLGDVDEAKKDGRLPMEDHNTRIIVFGRDGAQAQAVAETIAQNAFHNVSYYTGPVETLRTAETIRPLSNSREIERLEEQISIIVQNAAQAGKPLSNWGIDRFYAQIDMLRLNAVRDPSVGKLSSSEQGKALRPSSNSRAIELMEEQLSMMLFNAAKAGKPLSNREIDRLEEQIDLMQAAEAQARYVSSTQIRLLRTFAQDSELAAFLIEEINAGAIETAQAWDQWTASLKKATTREEQRAADRQDDLRDMTQYWNQLKQSAASSSTSTSPRSSSP
jgi:rhodanese-related sulfurtransferase